MSNNTIVETKKRVVWIDFLRVLASLVIVSVHFNFVNPNYGHISRFVSHLFFESYVPIFFVISGYFSSFNLSIKKRVNRILWLLIALISWNFISCFVLGHSMSMESIVGINASNCFSVFKGWNSNMADGALWFLKYLIIFMIMLPLFTWFKQYSLVLVGAIILWSLGEHVVGRFFGVPNGTYYTYNDICTFFYNFSFFLLGAFSKKITINNIERFFKIVSPVVIVLCPLWVLYLYTHDNFNFSSKYWLRLSPYLGVVFFISLSIIASNKFKKFSVIVADMGKMTFTIYALHMIVFVLISRFSFWENIGSWMCIVLLFGVTAFCILFHYCIERWIPFLAPVLLHQKTFSIWK